MDTGSNSFRVGIDFESILRAISKQIYETPHAFIRENVQNAVDAIRIQALRDGLETSNDRYHIQISVDDRKVIVQDNGIGMSKSDLKNYFWTIGASGKRSKEAHDAGCVGMFGIGGFANFGVCDLLEVTSQTEKDSIGTLTRLSAKDIEKAGSSIPEVTIQPSETAGPRGTIVIGYMKQAPNVDDIKIYLKSFVRFVPITITFNNENISEKRFENIDNQDNLTSIESAIGAWGTEDIGISAHFFEDGGHTLVAAIYELTYNNELINLTGQLRFEKGPIDVFKRGFKLCATQIPSTIGISGRLDCDLFVPTAGRDSLDASTTNLLNKICKLLEDVTIDIVFDSQERIAENTRIFRLVVQRDLIKKMDNVLVRLADGTEMTLSTIRQRASEGDISVFFGTTKKQALNQIMQARGHIVVQLSGDRFRRRAERLYLERYCAAKPFDGIVDCAEIYSDTTRFEKVVLAQVEQNISNSYEITNFRLIPGNLTEDIPAFVKERSGNRPIEIFIDVRHAEVKKLKRLGLSPLMYSIISVFCREYIGPSLKKWSPRFFGDGSLNFERFAKRRSELWILVPDDISVVRKDGQREIVTQHDVRVIRVGDQHLSNHHAKTQTHRLLRIIDEDNVTGLAGYYIRLPDSAFRAYGDLLGDCDSHAVVWTGNKMTFVASDGISAQFQYEIRLDEIVATEVDGRPRAEGVLELERPLQEIYGSVYFPIPFPPWNDSLYLWAIKKFAWIFTANGSIWGAAGCGK